MQIGTPSDGVAHRTLLVGNKKCWQNYGLRLDCSTTLKKAHKWFIICG